MFLMMALGSDVLSEYPANYLGRGGFIPDDRIVKGHYLKKDSVKLMIHLKPKIFNILRFQTTLLIAKTCISKTFN